MGEARRAGSGDGLGVVGFLVEVGGLALLRNRRRGLLGVLFSRRIVWAAAAAAVVQGRDAPDGVVAVAAANWVGKNETSIG